MKLYLRDHTDIFVTHLWYLWYEGKEYSMYSKFDFSLPVSDDLGLYIMKDDILVEELW